MYKTHQTAESTQNTVPGRKDDDGNLHRALKIRIQRSKILKGK